MKNADYFSQYVTEDFNSYIKRKRENHCHGNHIEMQAMCEMYNRTIEVYQYSTGGFELLADYCTHIKVLQEYMHDLHLQWSEVIPVHFLLFANMIINRILGISIKQVETTLSNWITFRVKRVTVTAAVIL